MLFWIWVILIVVALVIRFFIIRKDTRGDYDWTWITPLIVGSFDSDHNDRRRKDFNQAIFFYDDYTHEHKACFCGTNMEMVLQCFDDAVKDWRRTWCDVENCTRKP